LSLSEGDSSPLRIIFLGAAGVAPAGELGVAGLFNVVLF